MNCPCCNKVVDAEEIFPCIECGDDICSYCEEGGGLCENCVDQYFDEEDDGEKDESEI